MSHVTHVCAEYRCHRIFPARSFSSILNFKKKSEQGFTTLMLVMQVHKVWHVVLAPSIQCVSTSLYCQALFSLVFVGNCKRALRIPKRGLYIRKRSLYFRTRALRICKRALYIRKEAYMSAYVLYMSLKRALNVHKRVL